MGAGLLAPVAQRPGPDQRSIAVARLVQHQAIAVQLGKFQDNGAGFFIALADHKGRGAGNFGAPDQRAHENSGFEARRGCHGAVLDDYAAPRNGKTRALCQPGAIGAHRRIRQAQQHVVPSPSADSSTISPPCIAASDLTSARPRPVPSLARVWAPFHLLEWPAQLFQVGFGDAGAGIADRQDDAVYSRCAVTRHAAAARREFDAVADEIDQHLLDGALVGENLPRLRRDLQFHRHAAALRRMADKAHGGSRDFLQIEQFFMQFELAGLDLGHVEHAVDQLQQMAAQFMDQPGIFLVARLPTGPKISRVITSEKPIMAFSGVRSSWLILARKAVLAREALSAASRASISAQFLALAFGNIARHRHDVGGAAHVIQRRRAAAYLGPEITFVAVAQAHFRRAGAAGIEPLP